MSQRCTIPACLGCLVLALPITAVRVGAQASAPTAVTGGMILTGLVSDTIGAPLADVQVHTLGAASRTATDARGRYRLALPQAATVESRLEFRRLGFRSETLTVVHAAGATGERVLPPVHLRPVPQALAGVEVRAAPSRYRQRVAGIVERHAAQPDRFITRAELEALGGGRLTDLFRRRDWVRVVRGVQGRPDSVAFVQRSPGAAWQHGCRIQYFVDGRGPEFVEERVLGLNAWRPEEIQTIEFYRWPEETPEEYRTPSANCGVIALWTRGR